jgi:superfamily II DNA/RNA helicase
MKSIDLSYKVKILCQILDASKAAGDKVLVFSQSIPTLNFLEDLCARQRRRYARLDGKTTMSKRQDMTKAFNKGKTEIYLISTAAGGLGLNLPSANRVIIFDFKFNPIMEEQAVGRAYRIGQLKPTFVYRFVAGGTFEDSVHNKTVFKMQLASRVVDKKNPVAWATKKLGDFLFEPKDVPQKDLSEFVGMDPLVLDKILESQGHNQTIRSIVQSDTFERDDDDKLTAEELKEVKQLLSDEQLKRFNPQKWHQLQMQRSQQAYNQVHRQALGQQVTPPQMNPGSSNKPSGANLGLDRPSGDLPTRSVNEQYKPSVLPPPGPQVGVSAGRLLSTISSSVPNGALPVKPLSSITKPAPLPSQVPRLGLNVGRYKSPVAGNPSHRSDSPIAGANTNVRTPTPENDKKSSGGKTPASAPIPKSARDEALRREGNGSPEKQKKVRILALTRPIESIIDICIYS